MSEKKGNQGKSKHKVFWKEKYTDYYGENPPFDLKGYKGLGRWHFFAEILIYVLFGVFFVYGVYNAYHIGKFLQSNYSVEISSAVQEFGPYVQAAKDYSWRVLLTLAIVYLISLGLGYLIVRIFVNIAWILMYGSLFLQIGLFGFLYWKIDWEYNWVFLIPLILNILVLTIWAKRFKRAIKFLKSSCMAVYKERKILIPQFIQSILLLLLTSLYIITTVAYFFKITPEIGTQTYNIGSRSLSVNERTIFSVYTILFVLLTYIVYNTTKAMKILMLHAWYRGGRYGFWKSYKVVRFRYFGIFTFSLLATLAHMVKFIKQILKGEFGPKNAKEAFTLYKKIRPVDMETMKIKDKKKIGFFARIFYYINYFTLYAIIIENKRYFQATLRSLHLSMRNIPDLFIKKSHVNFVFRMMQASMLFTNGLVGAILGATVSNYFGLDYRYGATIGVLLFLWIAGGTITLILNDLNLAYKTVMYIYTIDDLNNKEGYNRYDLEIPLDEEEMKELEEEESKKLKKIDETKKLQE